MWLRLPLVPVIVSVKVPRVVVLSVLTVSVAVAEVGFGLNVAVAPLGRPLTLSVTAWLKLPEGVTVTPNVVLDPRLTVREAGEADREKSGACTIRVTVVVCVRVPLAPVMVKG